MKKLALALGALILFGGGCVLAPQKNEKPAVSPRAKTEEKNVIIVEMTANGFNPPAVDIKAGTTVKFVNKDTVPHWPASGVHPTHEICKGFDAQKPLASGESYSYTFTEVKTCPMHDHLNPGTKGTITVVEK